MSGKFYGPEFRTSKSRQDRNAKKYDKGESLGIVLAISPVGTEVDCSNDFFISIVIPTEIQVFKSS